MLIISIIGAWFIQHLLPLNWDNSWGLREATRLLNGGQYARDFFEPSPPMFLYLYAIPVLISKFFYITLISAFQGFVFFIAFISFIFCFLLSKKIFLDEKILKEIFLLTLTALFLGLPFPTDFGQREHLFFILITPYILLIGHRASGKAIHPRLAIMIGTWAALGFAIKPFFLLTFLTIEIYFYFLQKKWVNIFRPESNAILLLLGIHALIIFFFHSSYISVMLPFLFKYHYQSYVFSWRTILFTPVTFFCFWSALFYLSQWRKISFSPKIILFTQILWVAFLSFFTLYLIQRTPWEYHLLPAYSIAIIICVLGFTALITSSKKMDWEILGLLMLMTTMYFYQSLWTIIVFSPFTFFSFIGIVSFFLLHFAYPHRSIFFHLFLALLIIGISSLFSFFLHFDEWNSHQFLFTSLFVFLLLWLFLSRTTLNYLHTLAALFVFAYPTYHAYVRSTSYLHYKNQMQIFTQLMNTYASHQPIYFLSTTMIYEFPIIDDTSAIHVSQFPSMAWLAGIQKSLLHTRSKTKRLQLLQDKAFLIHLVSKELLFNKPALIFVDSETNKPYLDGIHYEFIQDFSTYPLFRTAWKAYNYFATIEQPGQYKFNVYKRMSV